MRPHATGKVNASNSQAAAEWVAPSTLRPWAKNPRANDGQPVAKVAKSIKRFGFAAPIVARAKTREIIAGHTRWKAALALKLDQVPVRFLDLTERQAHLLALADNRLNELAAWEMPAVHDILAGFDMEDVHVAGFDMPGLKPRAGRKKSKAVASTDARKCPGCGRYIRKTDKVRRGTR